MQLIDHLGIISDIFSPLMNVATHACMHPKAVSHHASVDLSVRSHTTQFRVHVEGSLIRSEVYHRRTHPQFPLLCTYRLPTASVRIIGQLNTLTHASTSTLLVSRDTSFSTLIKPRASVFPNGMPHHRLMIHREGQAFRSISGRGVLPPHTTPSQDGEQKLQKVCKKAKPYRIHQT